MSRSRIGTFAAVLALVVAGALVYAESHTDGAGEVNLTIVNVETPQGVKVWLPTSIFAKKGDKINLRLINHLTLEHGFKIEAFGIEEVVAAEATTDVSFMADKAGIFPLSCQLHPPHVAGQLVVLD